MSSAGNMIVIVLPLLAVFLAIPVWIGVYVYRDAKRRGMNAVLWTIIAVIAPSLIGFIIYLLVRGNYPDLACANCGETVAEDFVVCPNCGAKLRASCPNCAFPVEADWSVCPRCATPLPERQSDIVSPVRHADKTLWKILVAIIAVPVLLILMLILLAGLNFSSAGAGVAGMMDISIDDYFEEKPPKLKIKVDGEKIPCEITEVDFEPTGMQ